MTKTIRAAVLLVSFASTFAHAKLPTIPLECGKKSEARAERHFLDKRASGGALEFYTVEVTFTGKKPPNTKVESVLRECIAAAVEKDPSKDILASAWLKRRVGASDNDDVQINPFGGLRYISYTAATKSVAVHEPELIRKKER